MDGWFALYLHEVEWWRRCGVCVDVINRQQGQSDEQDKRSHDAGDYGRVLGDPVVVRSRCL